MRRAGRPDRRCRVQPGDRQTDRGGFVQRATVSRDGGAAVAGGAVAVPIVGLLVDLTARRSGGRLADAEEFVRFISTPRTAKVALIAAWAFAGYHLFAR